MGELVITWYSFPWWITKFPSTYSKTAISPEGFVIARCNWAGLPLGSKGAMIWKGSFLKSSTASATVPWLSNTYWSHKLIEIRDLSSFYLGPHNQIQLNRASSLRDLLHLRHRHFLHYNRKLWHSHISRFISLIFHQQDHFAWFLVEEAKDPNAYLLPSPCFVR